MFESTAGGTHVERKVRNFTWYFFNLETDSTRSPDLILRPIKQIRQTRIFKKKDFSGIALKFPISGFLIEPFINQKIFKSKPIFLGTLKI